MTQISMPTYIDLKLALSTTALKLHAAETHGLVSGVLAGDTDKTTDWETLVTGGNATPQAHALLASLYKSSEQQLREFLFEFQLLLPTDDEALPDRAEALSSWCQGFLTGLKAAGIDVTDRDSGEMSEAIADLIEVASMNYEEVVDNDEDEAAYIELVEYVRLAVILIYQAAHDINAGEPVKNANKSVH